MSQSVLLLPASPEPSSGLAHSRSLGNLQHSQVPRTCTLSRPPTLRTLAWLPQCPGTYWPQPHRLQPQMLPGRGKRALFPKRTLHAILGTPSPTSKWSQEISLESTRAASWAYLLHDALLLVYGGQVAQDQLCGLSFSRAALATDQAKGQSEVQQAQCLSQFP